MRTTLVSAAAAMCVAASVAAQDVTLKMATIAPSLGQAITMATFANVVTDNLDGIEIEVSGGGAATLHMMEVGRGNLDLSMTSPVVYNLMSAGKAMYAKEADAPDPCAKPPPPDVVPVRTIPFRRPRELRHHDTR